MTAVALYLILNFKWTNFATIYFQTPYLERSITDQMCSFPVVLLKHTWIIKNICC
jgi:hypothetical protein